MASRIILDNKDITNQISKNIDSSEIELENPDIINFSELNFDFSNIDLPELDINLSELDFDLLKHDFNLSDISFDFSDTFGLSIPSNKEKTNYIPSEKELIDERKNYLEMKLTPLLISLIKNEDFEHGKRSESIRLVEEQMNENKVVGQYWFNSLYIRNFTNDDILLGLLRIVEYLSEELLFPTGQTMAMASLVHANDEIKEQGIRIFENWCSIESYNILKSIKVDTKWLQDYINQVINDFESELCLC